MKCKLCGEELERIEFLEDYNDPNNPYGHGQRIISKWVCPECDPEGESNDY